jgi:hypothetical protein
VPQNLVWVQVFEGDRGKKYCQVIHEAQYTIEVVATWARFNQLTSLFEIQLGNALKKDVTIHIITQKPPNQHFPKWVNTTLSKTSLKIKTLQNLPAAAIIIFDQNTAAIAFNPNASLTKGPDLWTTNPALTTPCQEYFNAAWTQTKTKNCSRSQ